ncbi:protein unc-45 homolog B-like [Temnothorax curvispinosus]|uniref:Protein unc-45 homolog B-like n=1 Tax=Temnothorax curvispinosus TaxID=300111 RepID=A0A6J1Q1E5_9HYME|nr:protein unc-45 homolog B-like [Temnothorax curvispinosus]
MTDQWAMHWNKKGVEEYKKGNFSEALSYFTYALNKNALDGNDTFKVYYQNRAVAFLMLHNYEKVVEDCNSALKICCNKALYCRCQALEALERFEEAYRDAEIIISSDPNNKSFQCIVERLHKIVQERKERSHISAKVSKRLDLAFDENANEKEREIAMNKLLVLARERFGAEEIFKKEVVSKIAQLVKVEKNEEVICSAIRIVGELCKNNISRTESVMKYVGLLWCLEMMNICRKS